IPFLIPWMIYNIIFSPKKPDLSGKEDKDTAKEYIVIFSDECPEGTHWRRALAIENFIQKNRKDTLVVHISLEQHHKFPNLNDSLVYSIPSRARIPGMIPKHWNGLTENILDCVLQMYDPKYFIFDGKYPFRGILDTITRFQQINRYWIQSPFRKVKASHLPTGSFEIFDAIIHPTMMHTPPVSEIHLGRSGHIFTAPMVISHQNESSTRQDFIDFYDLPSSTILVLFNYDNRTSISSEIIEHMLKQDSVHIISDKYHHTKSSLHPRFHQLQGYGLEKMYQIADVAIVNSNIWSLHSAIYSNTPALCILQSESDVKQYQNHFNELSNIFITIEPNANKSILIKGLDRLIDPEYLTNMKEIMSDNKLGDGIRQFVDLIDEPTQKSNFGIK
ncbi:MAG: hypothetical protein CMA65_01740, partial [Euryarchaeota archaeon]|nr:hypothetical protein [Euryarchaeota archaeon]